MLTMSGGFHRHGSAVRLYMKRKEGGRSLISVEEYVRLEEKGLYEYVKGSDEWMLKEFVDMLLVLNELVEGRDDYVREWRERREGLDEKVLHERFLVKLRR